MEVILLHLHAGDIHFHFDNIGVNAVDGGTQSFIEQKGTRRHTKGRAQDGRS